MEKEKTVSSDTADGKHHEIKLKKTGAATATVELTTWQPGQNPEKDKGSKQTFNVRDIKAADDGSSLVCKGPLRVTVTVTIQQPEQDQMPVVKVKHPLGTNEYPVTETDETELKAFIKSCGFPKA